MDTTIINPVEIVLLLLTGIFLLIQILYYTCLYSQIHRKKKLQQKEEKTFTEELPPLSVIICAKNESENLRRYLPAILEQDYPVFEVIVINNGSTDDTEDLLTIFEEKYPHLYHSFTPEDARFVSHKKLALTLGIKASKYDWLVFTEANCTPVSRNWLRLMARNFTPKTEIVLGHYRYEEAKGWFHEKVSFNALFTAMRYLGFALIGKPYMGIGRNMAYRKELFFKQKGFSTHLNLRRGDDDLFVNQAANGTNTQVELDEEAIIQLAQPNHRQWKEEQLSYVATSKHFKGSQRYLSGFETFSRIMFYLTVIAAIACSICFMHWLAGAVALSAFIVRLIIQNYIVNKTAGALGEKCQYRFKLLLFDIILPLQSLQIRIHYLFNKRGDILDK